MEAQVQKELCEVSEGRGGGPRITRPSHKWCLGISLKANWNLDLVKMNIPGYQFFLCIANLGELWEQICHILWVFKQFGLFSVLVICILNPCFFFWLIFRPFRFSLMFSCLHDIFLKITNWWQVNIFKYELVFLQLLHTAGWFYNIKIILNRVR